MVQTYRSPFQYSPPSISFSFLHYLTIPYGNLVIIDKRLGLTHNNIKTLFLSGDSRGAPEPYLHAPRGTKEDPGRSGRRSQHPGERVGGGTGVGDAQGTSTAGLEKQVTGATDMGRKGTPPREIPVLSWGYDENEFNDSGKEPAPLNLASLSLTGSADIGHDSNASMQSSRSNISMTSTGTVKFTASHLKWSEPLPCGKQVLLFSLLPLCCYDDDDDEYTNNILCFLLFRSIFLTFSFLHYTLIVM